MPLLKGKPEFPPLAVTNPIFAFTIGTLALLPVTTMNLYVDTWAGQYINAVAYNPDGSPNVALKEMTLTEPTLEEKWAETWGSANSMMGILGFAYIDGWPMLTPVLQELFSFDALGDVWAEAGFEGDPPEMCEPAARNRTRHLLHLPHLPDLPHLRQVKWT